MLQGLGQALSVSLMVLVHPLFARDCRAEQASGFARIQTFKTHSRLLLQLDPSIEVVRQKTDIETVRGFELLIKGVSLGDLGAPFGSEAEWVRQLDGVSRTDPRLGRIQLRELETGVEVRGAWSFPSGKSALAKPGMETFHYRKDNAYVIDFWLKPGPTVIQARAVAERRSKEEQLQKIQSSVANRQAQRRAVAQARSEMEDALRFCRDRWDEGREVFLPFTAAKSGFAFDKHLPQRTPDQDYPYSEPTGSSEEAQYFRLALKLYRKGKFALAQKTLDFFDRKFKDTRLADESRFLRANAVLKMGFEEQGGLLLNQIVSRSHSTPAALHAAMFLALRKHRSGDMLGAFESFMWLVQNHGTHRLAWVFHMGVAEAIAALRQTPRAVQEYRWVIENAPDPKTRVEGAVRIGDLYLERRQYDQALAAYFIAIQDFKGELDRFPQFWINRAETLYWMGQHERASEAFKDFQSRFGSHPSAWRASYRLSEIEGREGNEKDARRLMIETINRYPYSPGAMLARARVMACEPSQRPGLDGIQAFFEREMAKFTGDGEVLLDRFSDYRGLAHVRALLAAGEEEQAISVALRELDGRSDNAARTAVARMLEHLFRKSILKRLGEATDDASRLSALGYYHEMGARIPHFPGNVDSDYLLKLSQAAIHLGMGTWSQELARLYQARAGSDRVIAMSGEQSLDRRLLESERAFTEARSLWNNSSAREPQLLEQVRSLLGRVIEESPFSYEKELISSLVEQAASRPALALTHLLKAQALSPSADRGAGRMVYLMARLQSDAGNISASVDSYRTLRSSVLGGKAVDSDRLAALGLAAVPSATTLLMLESEQLGRLKRWGEIASLLGDESTAGSLNSPLRYRYAMALSQAGGPKNSEKSAEVLRGLAEGAPEEFWKNLAREALNNPKVNAKEGRL